MEAAPKQSPAAFVEQLRSDFEAESGDRRLARETGADAFVETIAPHATDDFTCVMNAGALTTTYEGLEGLREGWRDFLSAFETMEIVPGELHESAGGDVVEFVRLIGTPVGTTAELDEPAAALWRIRDSRVAGVEFHIHRAEALRAAGLEPGAQSCQA